MPSSCPGPLRSGPPRQARPRRARALRVRQTVPVAAAALVALGMAGLVSAAAWADDAEPTSPPPADAPLPNTVNPSPAQHAVPGQVLIPYYTADQGAFVGERGRRYNNRPLYCNQISAIVVTGDRPLVRFGVGGELGGTFIAALRRHGTAIWLHQAARIATRYRPDHMQWTVGDPAWGVTTLVLDAVPTASGPGMALRLHVDQAQPGDALVWAFGGAHRCGGVLGTWDVSTHDREPLLDIGFVPADCQGNVLDLGSRPLTIRDGAHAAPDQGSSVLCSRTDGVQVGDAARWTDAGAMLAGSASAEPIACGVIPLAAAGDIAWAMRELGSAVPAAEAGDPMVAYAAGLARCEAIGTRVVVDTPDARLNAMVGAANAVEDGVFRDGIFTHSGMRWGVALIGWRCMYGGTAFGWHDRIKTEARLCLAQQITVSDKVRPQALERTGLSCQSMDSRLFGKGRVNIHQTWHYDMQSQFFDQLIHAWRWTGDAELERMLRPALELHLEYIHDCFDPSDCGLYEAYANSWPTDDQWYNGGGTAEETAYAYAGNQAALEMAQRAGDAAAVALHSRRLDQIRTAFQHRLWVADQEHVGSYVEQGGHQRLHPDSWLYAIFCPIDARLLSLEQAEQSLYYTEWGLEREVEPYGGERCWTSNWVPSYWSLREMWPGDNYHLALAYFQTGLAEEGWNVLRGTFPRMAFYGPCPGDLGHPNGGTDFNDCTSMFSRCVVEGLFGYRPNYPNQLVTIAPQLPAAWPHAAITTPDVQLTCTPTTCRIELTQPAPIDLRLPIRARAVTGVTVDGHAASYELLPGFGCSIVHLRLPRSTSAAVAVSIAEPLPQATATVIATTLGTPLTLTVPEATAVQQAAVVPTTPGHHVVDSVVLIGQAPQRRQFKIAIADPAGDAARAAAAYATLPAHATWATQDISSACNGDVRTIFQQRYLSPRPNTCSLRLAIDGYSTWQMSLGAGHVPPTIDLTGVPALLHDGILLTPQGIPFAWPHGERNIAFTSLWDNWPHAVTVPVHGAAEGIAVLVCGSTNPMQCRIANAQLQLRYADGVVDLVDLVPPLNFWSLCAFGMGRTDPGRDYDYVRDGFCLPATPPRTVQLGGNCRAVIIAHRLRPGIPLVSLTVESLSQEVIIGLMGATLINPR
jgi:hypothetical protein